MLLCYFLCFCFVFFVSLSCCTLSQWVNIWVWDPLMVTIELIILVLYLVEAAYQPTKYMYFRCTFNSLLKSRERPTYFFHPWISIIM